MSTYSLQSPTPEPDGERHRHTYFMPAVLECASPDELITPPPPDDNNPEPIFITFKVVDMSQQARFCGLITRLVSLWPTWDSRIDLGTSRRWCQEKLCIIYD